MADNSVDLKTALSMFQQSAQQYGLSQAISGAQEKVQQIKMAGLKASEERRALSDVAQQTVMHMTGIGATAESVGNMYKAINPLPLETDPKQLYLQGLQEGNDLKVSQGKQLMDLDQKQKIQQLQTARLKGVADLAVAQSKQDQAFVASTQHISDKVNEYSASSRSVAGRLGNAMTSAKEAKTLLNGDIFTRMGQVEAARTIDKILSGGVATIAGTEELAPKTSAGIVSDLMLKLTNKPTNMDAPELKQYYVDIIDRMEATSADMISEGKLGSMKAYSQSLSRNPEKGIQYVADMTGFDPADISFNKRGGLEIKAGASRSKQAASAPMAKPAPGAASEPSFVY